MQKTLVVLLAASHVLLVSARAVAPYSFQIHAQADFPEAETATRNLGRNADAEERIALGQRLEAAKKAAAKWAVGMSIKLDISPKKMFKTYKLRGAKLENNPMFLEWLKYVDDYRAKWEGSSSFPDFYIMNMLKQSKSDKEIASLFEWLRHIPERKNFAEEMEKSLSLFSPASRTAMNKAWANSGVKPEEVFRILRLGQTGQEAMATSTSFRQWLWYIERYRVKMGDAAITDRQIGTMLNKKVPYLNQATLFQSVKEQLLKQDSDLIVAMLAENLQRNAFQRLIDVKATPARFEVMIATPLSLLRKEDLRYRAVEAFTLYFAAAKGGDAALEKVKALLKNNDLQAAVDAAVAAAKA